jgi:hypothetical protein
MTGASSIFSRDDKSLDGSILSHLGSPGSASASASATYALLAVAINLDVTLDRSSIMEKITVVLCVRPGTYTGWATPSPLSLLPFIKIVASL